QTVSVDLQIGSGQAQQGSDFTTVVTHLSFVHDDPLTKPFILHIIDDNLAEDAESVSLFFTNLSGAGVGSPNSSTALTILDNDSGGGGSQPTVSLNSPSGNEGTGFNHDAGVQATLSAVTDHDVT